MTLRRIVLFSAIIAAVGIPIWLDGASHVKWMEVSMLLAEFAIAFVIYYELEENRANSFLAEAHGEAYQGRVDIYDSFVDDCSNSATLEQRAEAFAEVIKKNATLSKKCDLQLLFFSKSTYVLRRSLFHHDLMIQWFPQVLIRLHFMLWSYMAVRESPMVWRDSFRAAVRESLDKHLHESNRDITIYSSKTQNVVKITCDHMRRMRDSISME